MDAPGKVPDSINCHACGAILDLTGQTGFTHVECKHCGALSIVPLQFGDFLLLNAIGIGGMGTVYKAIDLPLNRYFAIKILQKKLSTNPSFISSFTQEARAAASVNHPNVAQVYAFGELDNQYYLSMELCERGSLDDRITKLGRLPEAEVLSIGRQIASALLCAWQRGLLHRDVKPGNILFNEDGIPKIVDFGLARGHGHDAEDARGHAPDQIWGTPYYIAPEKLRGRPEDLRSDIYSLGATLFHALAGRPPFEADTAGEVVSKHATQPALSLKTYAPDLNERTTQVVARMLAKDPAERYETYDELIQDLTEAQDELKATQAVKVIVAPTGERFSVLSLVGTLVTLVICMAAVWFVWEKRVTIFQLQQPTTPVEVVNTATPPPLPAVASSEEVNFAEDTPWVKAWNTATLQLAQGHYTDALLGYDSALQAAGHGQFRQRQWIQLFQGLTLLAADRPGEASRVLARARDIMAKPRIPEHVTTGNFADVLIGTMIGSIPLTDVETAIPRLPPWAAALARFTAGFKYLEIDEFEKAATSFREYRKLDRTDDQQWAFNLQVLADKLARQCDQAAGTMADIETLTKGGKYEDALAKLSAAATNASLSALKLALLAKQPDLQRAAVQDHNKGQQERQAAETNLREQEEQDHQRDEDDARVIGAVEPIVAPYWENYDFKNALAQYLACTQKVSTVAGHKLLDPRISRTRRLLEFKQQLVADFAPHPYDGTDLRTRAGTPLPGKVARATDQQLICSTPYGEIASDWRDFAPAALVKLADYYAVANAAGDTPNAHALRLLRLAVFCKQYGQDRVAGDYAQQAVKLQPSFQAELDSIINPPPSSAKDE